MTNPAEELAQELAEEAERGNTGAARQLVDLFAGLLEDEYSPPTKALTLYIARCLKNWAESDLKANSSRSAFHLTEPTNRPQSQRTAERNIEIRANYYRYRANGMKRTKAVDEVASSFSTSRRNIEKIIDTEDPIAELQARTRLSRDEREKLLTILKS